MGKHINFLGLGIEVGQSKKGPAESHRYARQYFQVLKHLGLNIVDNGEIFLSLKDDVNKIFSENEVSKFDWSSYVEAYKKSKLLLQQKRQLLNWGGDHSIALSTVGAFCHEFPDGCVVWIDAHADLNLPDFSPSGHVHGMPLSVLLNLNGIQRNFPWLKGTLKPENLIYVGIRDLDPFESKTINELGIKNYKVSDVRWSGMQNVAEEILKYTKGKPLHISFDIDSADPSLAPSTGIHVSNGLLMDDLKTLGEVLSLHRDIKSMDIVEVNPNVGSLSEVEQTYLTAFVFLLSIFNQGGRYDGISRTDQAFYAAQMEQGL